MTITLRRDGVCADQQIQQGTGDRSAHTMTIIDQLRAAVDARRGSVEGLRGRIADLLGPIPVGTVLEGPEARDRLEVMRISTGASQWSNRTWEVTIRGRGYLFDGRLLAIECDQSYFDGSNLHQRTSERYVLDPGRDGCPSEEPALRWLSGRDTRAVAAGLPEAVAAYMERCEAERAANDATLTAA